MLFKSFVLQNFARVIYSVIIEKNILKNLICQTKLPLSQIVITLDKSEK